MVRCKINAAPLPLAVLVQCERCRDSLLASRRAPRKLHRSVEIGIRTVARWIARLAPPRPQSRRRAASRGAVAAMDRRSCRAERAEDGAIPADPLPASVRYRGTTGTP